MTDAHHCRPESVGDERCKFAARGVVETLGGLACELNRWLANHPDAAERIGTSLGDAVGSFRSALRMHNR